MLVFCLLLLLLVLLLRNILKLYAGQGSSGLGARLRSRMVLGAVLIALAPAVFMFLFSYLLMNRSHGPLVFAQYLGAARGLDAGGGGTGAICGGQCARARRSRLPPPARPRRELPALQDELASHRITLAGGFVVVYDKDQRVLASFQAPPESSPASLIPWLEEGGQGQAIALHGPLSVSLLTAAQRRTEPVMRVAGREYALGMAATASGKIVVVALPMPQGLSQPAMRIRSGSATYSGALPQAQPDSHHTSSLCCW